MLAKAVRNKCKRMFVFFLVFLFLIQGITPAFASDNGSAHHTPSKANDNPNYIASLRLNLAVMLYDGVHKEFVMDTDELTASLDPNKEGKLAHITPEYAKKFNENFLDMSVTQAYAQVFRRTQVAWNAVGASDTLLLMGPDIYWGNTGPGTVTMSADQSVVKGRDYFLGHRVEGNASYGGRASIRVFKDLEGGWLSSWGTAPNGNGVFKQKILDYLDAYFKNPETSKKPDVFFNELFANATSDEKARANRVWQYIAAGPNAVRKSGDVTQGPSYRWNKAFERSTDKLDSDQVFIGSDGIYRLVGGDKKVLDVNDTAQKGMIYDQIASYLDTLVSLSVLSDIGVSNAAMGKTIASHYLKAAIDCFGHPGAYVTEITQLDQQKSIIFDTWTSQAFTTAGNAMGGSAGTYTDVWGAYRKLYQSQNGVPSSDWRSLSQYNDFHLQPLAKDSKAAKEVWTGTGGNIAPETMDRIGLRLSLIKPDVRPSINDSKLDITIGSIWLPASMGYGPTSALLGRSAGGAPEKIATGLHGVAPNYQGIDNTQLEMVGGQFAVYMFAQALGPNDTGFTHSISATPDNQTISPREELNQNIKVTYKLGNKFTSTGEATVDVRLLDQFVDNFVGLANDPEKLSELQARTYLTRQVTKYKLDTLWMPGAGKPERVATSGITPDTYAYDVPAVSTALGTETVPAQSFNNFDADWTTIKIGDLKNLMTAKNSVMFTIDDDSYRSTRWLPNPPPELIEKETVVAGNRILEKFTHGSDYVLEVTYTANTEFRIANKDGSYETLSYTRNASDPSVQRYAGKFPVDKTPVYMAQASSNKFEPAKDPASFVYFKEPEYEKIDLPALPFVKEPMRYGVYSSSPEAYAELKNWGVASYNEPGDGTSLGDGRSPVDTQMGVSPSRASNGSDRINEDYEAMAGVPTTEKLYLAVGGSEFIIDIAVQYVPNETAVRTYHTHFDGVASQFNYKSASGAGGDIPEDSIFASYPKTSSVGASISGKVDHTGGTITYTVNGSIDASGSAEASGPGAASGGPWSLSVTSPPHGTSTSGKVEVTPNAADVQKFNNTMADIEKWVGDMSKWISGLEHTSGSDQVSRKIGKGELGDFTFTKSENSGEQAASGSFSVSGPSKLWEVDDGTETKFNLVTFSGGSYSVTNPRNLSASASNSCNYNDKGAHTGDSHSPGSDSQSKPTWSITISFTIRPHVICGPDCGHTLPEINDIWQQSFNYDYLKIIGLSVLRLDQGSANDETGVGLNALIGTKKLGVTRQTYYSSPTMSLAQANIFNYMGLQTDGTKDVYRATNEYFRSIAYGVGTTYGNTKSSEANRVQYFMTDADGKVLSAKGTKSTEFPRYNNKGNQEVKTSFANEMQASWKSLTDGIVDAGDYVYYDFGPRSNLSDGTSRGYQYNMDKSSWVEKKDGVWRGKAAYDLPWAKGFIYDGVKKNGAIDATGYSVSRSLRNSGKGGEMAGIYQNSTKGWQGVGMTTTTLNYKTISYDEPFAAEFYTGQNNAMKAAYTAGDVSRFSTTASASSTTGLLYQPAVRDWGKANHALYSDTRNLLEPGGASMPGAKADWSPREAMVKMWAENKVDRANDVFAQTQPFDTDNMLQAFTNTANDGGAKIRNTSEYKLMQAKRDELVYATVISDALVLDLPNGYQPIMYHYKNASKAVAAEDRIPDTRSSFEELWLNNLFTPNSWSDTPKGTAKDAVIIGGYNGDLSNSRTTTTDVQHRLRWRADAIPATTNMFIQNKTVSIEEPTGIIGKAFGAIKVNGYNINRHLGHNGDTPTRILSQPVVNKSAVGIPTQRTLLYNVAPIVLSADNREYSPGKAEVFWETIVQWKDDSNHDYYGKFVTGDGKGAITPDVYMPDGTFVRLPALLGNYGQKERSETLHTFAKGAELMKDFFKYTLGSGGPPLEAYGASEARAAQAEQYSRGFGITGYNYDTTNRKAIDGKTFKNMYNESPDLTGSAKVATPYVAQDTTNGIRVGVPFIVEVVKDDKVVTGYKATSAKRTVGSIPTGEPKAGYIQRAAYTTQENEYERYELNNIVIHNVVSARATQIMPIAEWRDQRVLGQSLVGADRDANRLGAPGTLEFAILDCKYDKPLELLKLNFIGSGKSVPNQAKDQVTTGNIVLAGNYTMSSTGLTSGGSARTGVGLADLGGEYYKALDYQVTSEITYNANTGEQMLFGFQGYGITLDTANKKLYIRKSGSAGYMEVAGVFNSGDTLKVRFGSENATLSEVWVNGSKRALTLKGGEFNTMSIGKNQVGANFYIGAWEKGSPAYTPTATTRYQSVLLERLAGSHEHTEACKSTTVHHVGGNNTHVHTLACLGPESSHKYLAGAIQDWNNYKIDDATLRKYLGESLWNQLGMPRKTTAFIKTTNNITLNRDEAIEVPIIKGSQNFNFTGGVQTFTAPGTGDYTFEVWGAQGATGTGGGAGGTGGYAKGTINLTAGQVVSIYVGGQNGFNGGGSGGNSANSGGNGGGATDIRVGGVALSNRVLVAGGGGGSSGGSNGGSPNNRYSLVGANGGSAHGGDGTAGNPSNASSTSPGAGRGATGSAGGAGGAGNSVNSTSSSDGAYYQSGGGGGGGGYYGGGGGASAAMNGGSANRSGTSGSAGTLGQGGSGGSGITSTPQAYWSGTGGGGGAGSGYIGGVTGGTMTNAGRTGNGYATVSYDIAGGGGAETLLNYTGNYQTYTAPTAGTYTFELWGAQGGNNGAYGQYVKESRVLSAGQTVYVYVGGQGTTSSGSGGGWNGGGHNYNGYGGGGGATDIRIGGTALTNRVIVAGGGAGLSHTGSAYTSHNRYSVLGVGQNATGHHGAGGGGGYYGGTGGTGCDGIAYSGSSFAAGAERTSNYSSGGTVVTYGSRAGNGQVKITAPPAELNKTYTFTTPSNPSELDIDVRRLTGTSNMKIDLHKGATPTTANRIGTVTGNPNAVYPTTVLEPNTTYTIVVSTATAVTTSFNIKATLTSRGLTYSDIVSLPNVGGKAAWEQIPYNLPDGTRNPMYRCNGELNTHVCDLTDSKEFGYTGGVQTFTAPKSGVYTLEVWGAQGGGGTDTGTSGSLGGRGGYSKGNITLAEGETIQVYVGGQGTIAPSGTFSGGGFNGGGNGANTGFGGGGATDIRRGGTSLDSRIIVAGGGGGADNAGGTRGGSDDGTGGAGGGSMGEGAYINGHLVQQTGGMGAAYEASELSMWRKAGNGTFTWDAAEKAYKAVGHVQMYLLPEFAYKIDPTKEYTIKVTAKVSNNAGMLFYWGGDRLDANKAHLSGFGGTYDYSAASAIATGNIGWTTYTATKQGVAESASGWGTAKYYALGGLLNYSGTSTQTTWVKDIQLYEDGVLVQSFPIPKGSKGQGASATVLTDTGGGGGGYYGGLATNHNNGGAGGGSGYVGGVTGGVMTTGANEGHGKALITWAGETLCFETVTFDKCTEPHHKDGHYENDWLCYSPDLDDNKYDPNFVQNSRVNTKAAEFVSLDWDYTLYADSIDNLRSSTAYQLNQTISRTGMGYYDTNINGDFDDVRFVRGKYVKFPWTALYDGILYGPDEWVVLGDRGTYNKGYTKSASGLGGSHYNSTGDLFHGQQVAYNVQNWSLYNQQIYHDLYKSFYDFYLPIINDEQSLATVTYAVVAVNAPDDRGLPNAAGHAVLSAVSDLNSWLRSGTVSNKVRKFNRAEVGAGKVFKVDVVGRIGGLVMNDTTDVKFSDTFKKPLASEEETKVVYDIDMADLQGTKPNRTTRPLQASSSITTGGKLVNGPDGQPDRAKLTAPNDWVGFDYSGGNARKFVITVKGSGLQAGEFVLRVEDAANGNYTLRLADMTVNKKTNEEITVTVDVKQTNASVELSPRFNLIDTSAPNVYVESMSIAIGGSGFSQGLNQVVDPTKQNFYITDLTDVRGIYLGPAVNTGRAEEGQGALAWRRYHNYTNITSALGDWIRMSDATQVRNSNNISGRSTPEYGTRAVDTYGSRPWVQMEDPVYRALAGSGGKAIVGPLTSDHNVINQYRRPEAQLSVGSKVFFDITTVGNYQGMTAELEIVPTYYLVDTTRVDANGAVALIPVDVYQFSSAGKYQPVNIFGAPYGGFTPSELDTFNQYRLSVNWQDEATGANNRRMVTNEEWQATASYANLFTDWIFEEDPYLDPNGDFDDPANLPKAIGRTQSPRKLPSGVMPIGGSQYIYQDYRTQTFIGSNNTYGVDKSAGLFTEFMSDPTESAKYVYWQSSAQRWHSTLGLPSDAVFVPLQQDPVTNKFTHVDAKDIVKYAVDITENLIIGYIDTYANGSVWRLHYGNQGLQRTFSIGEQAYKLPLAGPAGPAMANPYPGQTSVGSDYVNGGIPFVIFGGSKVEGQADIIKTN